MNSLVKLENVSGTIYAVSTATTDTGGANGVCSSGCGTSGSGSIVTWAVATCAFDGTAKADDWVQISTTTAGDCHDTGSSTGPTSGQLLGRVVSGGAGAGNYTFLINKDLYPVTAAQVNEAGHNVAAPLVCADSSGSGTAQSYTTSPTFTPAPNDCVIYTTTTANTGALTLNVNSTAADAVQKWLGTAVASGDLPSNHPQIACLDGSSHWQLSTIGNAPSGGGGLPSSTAWQTYFNKAGTPAATSAITVTSTSAGASLGFGQTAPVAQLDFSGGENHLAVASGLNAVGATISATATTGTVASCTSLNATGGYAILGVNQTNAEIVAYSSCSGTTMTFNTAATTYCTGATAGRGCFGSTAASHNISSQVVPASAMWNTANSALPTMLYYWYNGSPYFSFGEANIYQSNSIANFVVNGSIGANQLYLSPSNTASANLTPSPGGGVAGSNSANKTVLLTDGTTPTFVTTAQSIPGTGVTTAITNLALSATPVSGQVSYLKGECHIGYSQSTATAGVQFGISQTNAATDLWVMDGLTWNGTAIAAISPTTITSGTATAITGTITPAAITTQYWVNFTFTVQTTTTTSTTMQITAGTQNGSDAVVIAAGSSCGWRP